MVDRPLPLSYRDAGVDIDAGNALVQAIKPLARATARPGADGALGGFGALFDLKACGFRDPVLVAATDGVGTKLKIAFETGLHAGIGIDLVAMSVNDLLVQGAEPLIFLDYFATGKLDVALGTSVVSGIAEGCRLSGCALVGGETAEMPGLYQGYDYDLAGFALGAVERDDILPRPTIAEGDVLLGLASSGPHSNGYSLIRQIVARSGLAWSDPTPFAPEVSLGKAFLTPTRIYVASVLQVLRQSKGVKGLVHITGGGFFENIPRVLPQTLQARIDLSAWSFPPIFSWLSLVGALSQYEMLRTFNCGVGMVLVVASEDAQRVRDVLSECGETVFSLGVLEERRQEERVVFDA